MSRGCQDCRVGETNSPVLSTIHIHLSRGAEDGDGRDEATGDAHGGGEERHLLGGQEVLLSRPLTSPCKEHSNQS